MSRSRVPGRLPSQSSSSGDSESGPGNSPPATQQAHSPPFEQPLESDLSSLRRELPQVHDRTRPSQPARHPYIPPSVYSVDPGSVSPQPQFDPRLVHAENVPGATSLPQAYRPTMYPGRHVVPSQSDRLSAPQSQSQSTRSSAQGSSQAPTSTDTSTAPQSPDPDIPDAGPALREQLRLGPDDPIGLSALPDPPPGQRPTQPLPLLTKLAIYGSPRRMLTLQGIYAAIEDRFEWYRLNSDDKAWKNSIRHNLSLNKVFRNVPRPVTEPGKGSYWCVDMSEGEGYKRPRKRRNKRSSTDGDSDESEDGDGDDSPPPDDFRYQSHQVGEGRTRYHRRSSPYRQTGSPSPTDPTYGGGVGLSQPSSATTYSGGALTMSPVPASATPQFGQQPFNISAYGQPSFGHPMFGQPSLFSGGPHSGSSHTQAGSSYHSSYQTGHARTAGAFTQIPVAGSGMGAYPGMPQQYQHPTRAATMPAMSSDPTHASMQYLRMQQQSQSGGYRHGRGGAAGQQGQGGYQFEMWTPEGFQGQQQQHHHHHHHQQGQTRRETHPRDPRSNGPSSSGRHNTQ